MAEGQQRGERQMDIEKILEIVEEFRQDKNPPYKAYEDTYMDGWLDACNEIYYAIFNLLEENK